MTYDICDDFHLKNSFFSHFLFTSNLNIAFNWIFHSAVNQFHLFWNLKMFLCMIHCFVWKEHIYFDVIFKKKISKLFRSIWLVWLDWIEFIDKYSLKLVLSRNKTKTVADRVIAFIASIRCTKFTNLYDIDWIWKLSQTYGLSFCVCEIDRINKLKMIISILFPSVNVKVTMKNCRI